VRVSDDQRRAVYRMNAQKSTGPKTVEGKARSRRNATKHGLRADANVMDHEDSEAVEA